jgi:general secretion pathway protein D
MKSWRGWIAGALIACTAGCAGTVAFRDAREEEQLGHWDLAVMKYAKALELSPDSSGYKAALARAKLRSSQFHFEKGKMYRASGRPDLAVIEIEQTVLLDPTNDYAIVELRKAKDELAQKEAERSTDSHMERIKKKTRGARAVMPLLEPSSDKPINLNFPQPKPIKQIYRALADAAGINIIFDQQLKDDNVSIVLTGIEFQKALETLLRQENHFYKIIDERTILIAADTPANRKTYEDLVIRTFFLSNGDVTEVANSLRALLQTTRISVNKAENSITLRDTTDKVSVAERIVEQNDKQLAEVVIDIELLQVNTNKLDQLGLLLKPYSVSANIPSPGTGLTNLGATVGAGQFTWDQLKQLSIKSFGFTMPQATLDFIKNNGEAELLAKPQLRVSEGQKAQLLIGDKVPIPVTSFQSIVAGTGTGGIASPVTSFQYQDIGIKIEVEPRVHHNKEITLKLQLEVSQLGTPTSTGQPVIGTRTVGANIRLKDGETNFLAGLFRTDKSKSKDTFPFLGSIPILGRLISHTQVMEATTDVVLTLTPHIIRIPDITEEDLSPVYVGTDSNISYQGTPRVENPTGDRGPFDQMQSRQAPVARPTAVPGAVAPPSNVVPGVGPSDIFRPPAPAPPSPQQVVPPQGGAAKPQSQSSEVQAADASAAGTTAILLDFDPAYMALSPGQQQSILVRATASGGFPGGTFVVRFDPSVVAAVFARPILGSDSGVANAAIESGRVILEIPGSAEMTGTRAVAEITLRGMAAGRTALSFEPAEVTAASATFSSSVVDVK